MDRKIWKQCNNTPHRLLRRILQPGFANRLGAGCASRTQKHFNCKYLIKVTFRSCLLVVNLQVGQLKPGTRYVFVIRAENAQGVSPPSALSDNVSTRGVDSRAVTRAELDDAWSRLSTKVVELKDVQPVSSTSVRLFWQVWLNVVWSG